MDGLALRQVFLKAREWKSFSCVLKTEKGDNMTATAKMNVKKGDILYSSWGYGQTNVNFWQVIDRTPCSVRIREIYRKKEGDKVLPDKDNFRETSHHLGGKEALKRLKEVDGEPCVKISDSIYAYKWGGEAKRETCPILGH